MLNGVSHEDKQKLWLPSINFVNALGTVDGSMIDSDIFLNLETEPYIRGREEGTEGEEIRITHQVTNA